MISTDDRTITIARTRRGFLGMLLVAACTLLTGCGDESFVGDETARSGDGTGQIAFVAGADALTRASGEEAATKLSNHFVVYATKHENAEDGTAANDKLVFNQYNVEWAANTAGTTVTNTHNWDYLGKTAYSDAVTTTQTTKYWDYDAKEGYTFYAFSSPHISYPAAATDQVQVSKITSGTDKYSKGYTVAIGANTDIDDLYFAERKEVPFADYNKPVKLTFRPFGAKVRVGFYETIPGYKVTINAFHVNTSANSVITTFGVLGTTGHDREYFQAAMPNLKTAAAHSYSVSYNALNEPIANYTGDNSNMNYMLQLGGNWKDKELGTSSSSPTYDLDGGAYTDVYPYESIDYPMLISCDYTLTSEEDVTETLKVIDAKAIVPAEYVRWRCGYAYTYLFKISLATNGHTGSLSEPEGLYPITFDAMGTAYSDHDLTTLTAMDKFAVTTYTADGYVYVVNTDKTTGKVYPISRVGSDVAGEAELYYISTTGDEISETTLYAKLTGSSNGIYLDAAKDPSTNQPVAELTDQFTAADGITYTFGTSSAPGVLKFKYEAGKYYAYVYTVVKHVDPTYTPCESSSTYDANTQYYIKENELYFATSVTETQFNAAKTDYYTQTTPGTTGEYALMLLDTRY